VTHGMYNWFKKEGMALLTDFYELTMMAGYLHEKKADQEVCFEYFFRSLPPHTGFAVAAGLEPFLDYLEELRFTADDIAYLRELGVFDEIFLDYLLGFRPSCTVRAIPEGTLVFPYEPIIQIEGPIIEAQLIETALLNILNYQTLIATKASRICLAAEGEPVFEFGLRRAHGPDGGLSGSRAAYIGGCTSTSNVLAGKVYGIPVAGTHAHSWVMSFPSEREAFRAFARIYPKRCVLLVDTYDPVESGIPNAIAVFKEMQEQGIPVRPAIRLDSGDLAKLSKIAYQMMTGAGLENPLIVASNELHEDIIADLKRQKAKINAWGVGTSLITSYNCPALSGVYKLAAVKEKGSWLPRIKVTSNLEKATDPGKKQIVRYFDADNHPIGDVLFEDGEAIPERGEIRGFHRNQPHIPQKIKNAAKAQPLLEIVFKNGRRIRPPVPVHQIRERVQEQIQSLPEEYKRLRNPQIYDVMLSENVGKLKERLIANPEQW